MTTDLPPPPVDESAWLDLLPDAAAAVAADLPLGARFRLRDTVTPVQRAFLDLNGYLVYDRVASTDEVDRIGAEANGVQKRLIDEDRRAVFGVPVWVGKDPDGAPYLQRLAFTS